MWAWRTTKPSPSPCGSTPLVSRHSCCATGSRPSTTIRARPTTPHARFAPFGRRARRRGSTARVGILGFSAGGHLASTAGTHFDGGSPGMRDPIERVSSRPDLMVLVYPVISLLEFAHVGSRINLLGENPDPKLVELLSNDRQVTAETPPAFLVASNADTGVPCENSLLFAMALRRAGVPFEMHIYEPGQHGFGLGGDDPVLSTWPRLCELWLKGRGFAL